ncbi:MAG TPA: sigma-70 family RNA polymerase sigma factor [Victivallales bacterium]|nr:sigma-70 family RNA polymerase sigma factor [Victivallales bacterium]
MNDLYLTRVTLIGNIKENKEEAWNEFCVFYWDVITGWARRLWCSDAVAKDVFQETIVSLMRQMPNFDYDVGKGRFRSFMKTIVKRRVYDIYRKEGKYVNFSSSDNDSDNSSDISFLDKLQYEHKKQEITYDSDLVWMDSILKKAIRIVAEKLDPKTYLSFKLYVLEERSVEDVIKATGIEKIGTVYQHKSRFLTALKNEFYALLNSTSEENEINFSQHGDKLFSQTLSSVIEGRIDLKTTVIETLPPEEMISRLNIVRKLISEINLNEEYGTHVLIFIENSRRKIVHLDKKITIGRSLRVDIQLDYDDISSIHATIENNKNEEVILKDEYSTNGTYLNGNIISSPVKLTAGDIVQIGSNSVLILL